MTAILEHLWPYPQELSARGDFLGPPAVCLPTISLAPRLAQDLSDIAGLEVVTDPTAYSINLELDASLTRPNSYRLTMNREGASIVGADEPGLAYGGQTLLQVLALSRKEGRWPELRIHDWPAYKKRSFMVDMGRSVFTVPLLKRIIRILARLKLNQLHLHLYDDELCGLRFEGFPFGKDNPCALSLNDLAEVVRYASQYHIEIVPELEGWGHVGSLVYHRPELRGGAGECDGSSFLIGEETFTMMKSLLRQVAEIMPPQATIHLGLDEALLFLAPDMPPDFSPVQLVQRYHQILQEIGDELGKDLTMCVWGDLVGERIPPEIRHQVIVQPWRYWHSASDWIDQTVETYAAMDDTRWMMGGGQSVNQYRGAYHATRHWCKRALAAPNVEGINITLWGSNDLEHKLLSLFAGAYYAWNPVAETSFASIEDYELFDRQVYPIMMGWQSAFRDAFPDEIRRDRGEQVFWGFYLWGQKHGQPVAPTAAAADTFSEHENWMHLNGETGAQQCH